MSTDKALSLVGPIMDAYNAAEKAGSNALRYALECGKHLNAAKKDVGKGKWKKWCENNLPVVSEETERVYRRLAEAVGKKEDVFAECKSIRDALQHLSGLDENLEPKPRKPRPKRTGSTAAALQPPEPTTQSPTRRSGTGIGDHHGNEIQHQSPRRRHTRRAHSRPLAQ